MFGEARAVYMELHEQLRGTWTFTSTANAVAISKVKVWLDVSKYKNATL